MTRHERQARHHCCTNKPRHLQGLMNPSATSAIAWTVTMPHEKPLVCLICGSPDDRSIAKAIVRQRVGETEGTVMSNNVNTTGKVI